MSEPKLGRCVGGNSHGAAGDDAFRIQRIRAFLAPT